MNKLYHLADTLDVEIINDHIPVRHVKGLCIDNLIVLDKSIDTLAEENCILAEELGHYITSYGNILSPSDTTAVKQEERARKWAYENLVTLDALYQAFKSGASNRYELADHLNITESFLDESLKYYISKYGQFYESETYILYFEPLGIFRKL